MEPSIGATLRDARIRQGLEIADCVRATRIRARYLTAIEEGRFEALPDPAYVSGFVRAYANHLGVELEGRLRPTAHEWAAPATARGAARPARIDLSVTRAPGRGPSRSRAVWAWTLVILLVLAVAVAAAVLLGALDTPSLPF